jgi:hypothetical protein
MAVSEGRNRGEPTPARKLRSPSVMNPSPWKPSEPSPDPCPECGSNEVTAETAHESPAAANPGAEKHVHVVRLQCKRGHVWSPA